MFYVVCTELGAYTTITRIKDSATKEFYQAGHTEPSRIISFMNSITDEQAENYFPKKRTK